MKKTIEISMVVQKESIDKGGDQIKEWMTLLSESVGKDLSRGIEDAMKGIDFSTEPEKAIAAMGDYKALSHETTAEQEKRKKVIDEEIDAIDQVIIKLQKETDKEQEINEERKKRGALAKEKSRLVSPAELAGAAVNEIQQQQKRIASRSAEYANGEMERLNQNFDIAQTYNQVLEKRLGIERELMEQANFGMGASVQAMQRQVDLAYEMMGIEKQRIASIESTLKSKMDEGAAEAALNARSAAERKEIVDAHTKDKNDVGFINQLLTKRQESMSTMMEQQKKIYELTKSIREGYLDAMHEMAAGAGQFEKIIGTQSKGTAQILDFVNQVTPGAGNTMKMGGTVSGERVAEGARSGYAGMITTEGAVFQSGAAADDANKDIYGYRQSVEDARRGEMNAPRVGTGLAAPEQGQDALREGAMDGTEQGVIKGLRAVGITPGFIRSGLLNPGVDPSRRGGSSHGNDEQLYRNQTTGLAMQIAASARASTPADAGRLTTAPGPMPVYGGTTYGATGGMVTGTSNSLRLSPYARQADGNMMDDGRKSPMGYTRSDIRKIMSGTSQQLGELDEADRHDKPAVSAIEMVALKKKFEEERSKFTETSNTWKKGQQVENKGAGYGSPGVVVSGRSEEDLYKDVVDQSKKAQEAKINMQEAEATQNRYKQRAEQRSNLNKDRSTLMDEEDKINPSHKSAHRQQQEEQAQADIIKKGQELRDKYSDLGDKDAKKKIHQDAMSKSHLEELNGDARKKKLAEINAAENASITKGGTRGALMETATDNRTAAQKQRLEASGAEQAEFAEKRGNGNASLQYGTDGGGGGGAGGGTGKIIIELDEGLKAKLDQAAQTMAQVTDACSR